MVQLLLLLLLPSRVLVLVNGKELIATHEWQKVGPTDTLPAGLEIRMDLSGGGKWARLLPEEIDPPHPLVAQEHVKRCGPSCKERQRVRAETRRASGYLLREPQHRRRDQEVQEEPLPHSSSFYSEAGLFLVGLTVGVGVATRVRKRTGLHES